MQPWTREDRGGWSGSRRLGGHAALTTALGLLAAATAQAADAQPAPADASGPVAATAPAPQLEDLPAISAAPPPGSLREAVGAPAAATRPRPAPTGIGAAPRPVAALAAAHPDQLSNNVDRFGTQRMDVAFDQSALPGRLAEPRLGDLWRRGIDLERRERLLESAAVYELIVGEVPEESYTYWRIARNYWRHGESLPPAAKQERVRYFELARSWSGRGISIDPECAPCMLWKFVAMGRLATTRGLLSAVGDVREMERLVVRGIELAPAHRDNPGNSTLGNLYYAGAVFYRVVPSWWWLELFVGVRGDMDRSLDYARQAVAVSQARVDYRVELGAVLLCRGTRKERPEDIRQGIEVLREAQELDDFLPTDHLDKEHAGVLIANPGWACGYSRDGFIDIDALRDEARTRR